MRNLWIRLGLALTILVSVVLSAGIPPQQVFQRTFAHLRSGSIEDELLSTGAATDGFQIVSKASPLSNHRGPAFQKGRSHEGGGAPPKDRIEWLPSSWLSLSMQRAENTQPLSRVANAHPFIPQGMQPEQGGQTGPPQDIVNT